MSACDRPEPIINPVVPAGRRVRHATSPAALTRPRMRPRPRICRSATTPTADAWIAVRTSAAPSKRPVGIATWAANGAAASADQPSSTHPGFSQLRNGAVMATILHQCKDLPAIMPQPCLLFRNVP